ncbi:hypothetical protein COY07_00900 [Candidatus Peregrinibacteria bacterium CG_4_10_14_0_2_um_filter_43_11]|nr:MAG: hypothetical protein COY07_00900 [Candidatus Peregrinibacteria bacterium CG_4_10_14_0_2_um_filter_43_11]
MKNQIFIDASRYNNTYKRTGVENYSYYLINALIPLLREEIVLVSPRPLPLSVGQLILPFRRLWTQVRLSWEVLWNRKIQTLFIPSHFMPLIFPKNTIITIHDVAFRHFPESYSRLSRWYLDWGTRFAVKHATMIITPSGLTKEDLIALYAANSEKIVVIPHGHIPLSQTNPEQSEGILKHYGLKPKKYLLFVGRIETKKNGIVLVKAFKKIEAQYPELKLVFAGKVGVGGDEIMKQAQENPNIIFTGYIEDATKAALLKNALVFVFPSLYEGFGFPLLEAMEARVPIIASNLSTSREIAGNCALFFEADDVEGLVSHLKTVLSQPDRSWNYDAILERYSWERCAQKTLKTIMDQYS